MKEILTIGISFFTLRQFFPRKNGSIRVKAAEATPTIQTVSIRIVVVSLSLKTILGMDLTIPEKLRVLMPKTAVAEIL